MVSNSIRFVFEDKIKEIKNPDPNETILNLVRLRLKKTGTSSHRDIKLFDFTEFCQLIGFDDVEAFEEKWLRSGDEGKSS